MEPYIIGALSGLLAASAMVNAYVVLTRANLAEMWRQKVRDAEDRANAAQVRSAEQIDAMLDRVVSSARLELRESAPPLPDPTEKTYISDFPYQDDEWNDLREEAARAAKDPE